MILRISNIGDADLSIYSISSSNSEFSVTTSPIVWTIPAAGNRDYTVRFSPNSAGSKSGTLSISNNSEDDPKVVTVIGTGN